MAGEGGTERLLGELVAEVKGLRRDIQVLQKDQEAADESRSRLHTEIGELRREMVKVESRLTTIDATVTAHGPVIARVQAWENRGIGWVTGIMIAATAIGGILASFWTKFVAMLTGG